MKNTLLNLSSDVKEICLPHFNKLDIDHFNYIHKDTDGNVTYLCSNRKWLKHYLEKSYQKIGAFENNPSLQQYNYILWNGLDKNDPILHDSREMIGVAHGVTIIKKEANGHGFYNIGKNTLDSTVINQYVNRLNDYENFIQQFQIQAENLLITAKTNKISFNLDNDDIAKKSGIFFGNQYLTLRECECIQYLSLGKTAEEISIILDISKRTVETHIENIKRKFDCYNQFRLGYLLGKLDINL